MAYLFTNLLQDAVAMLGNAAYFRGTATGGTATTLIDTSLTEKSEEDLKNGTLIIVRDAGGAGASPEGKFGTVSAYVDATFTMTIPTVTDAVASGDEYMHISPQYPLVELRRLANLGLQRAGYFKRWDTSITTADDQTEYTLPVALKPGKNLRVWIETDKDDSNDSRWKLVSNPRVIPSAAGVAGTLVIPQYDSGYTIGIEYEVLHPTLYAYSDVVDEAINPVLAQLLVAVEIFAWVGITDDNRDQANRILSDLADAKKFHKLPRVQNNPKYLIYTRE